MYVCVSVCLLVNFRELCKNDRNAVCVGDSGGPKEPLLDGVQIPQVKGAFSGVVRPTEKHCGSLLRCTQQKINNGISANAVANCIALNWSVLP